jgi:uncharacterized membrane-anchored protein
LQKIFFCFGEKKKFPFAQKAHKLAGCLKASSLWVIAQLTKLIANIEHPAGAALYNFGTTAGFRG